MRQVYEVYKCTAQREQEPAELRPIYGGQIYHGTGGAGWWAGSDLSLRRIQAEERAGTCITFVLVLFNALFDGVLKLAQKQVWGFGSRIDLEIFPTFDSNETRLCRLNLYIYIHMQIYFLKSDIEIFTLAWHYSVPFIAVSNKSLYKAWQSFYITRHIIRSFNSSVRSVPAVHMHYTWMCVWERGTAPLMSVYMVCTISQVSHLILWTITLMITKLLLFSDFFSLYNI